MHKKHMFLRVFSKITIFACVFCVFSACADTTTCDIDYTPVTGNSIQNGTPNPTSPVEIESVGTKVGNKYQISVVAQSKNLVNLARATDGYYYPSDGVYTPAVDPRLTDFIECRPSTNYTISGQLLKVATSANLRVNYFDSNKTWLSQDVDAITQVGNFTYTFTTPANAKYIRVSANVNPKAATFFDWDVMQIEEGSIATTYTPYSASITTTVYLDEPLRKVGDYADVLDYKKGQIIRNVGVKVLDGTESWTKGNASIANYTYYLGNESIATLNDRTILSTHFLSSSTTPPATLLDRANKIYRGFANKALICVGYDYNNTTVTDFKSWLASQYAAGTPVTVYYPLATPVVEQIENWSCTPPITDIKIATTKMVDEEFAAAEANLATTVQTIEDVVSRTIAQTGQIQVLQDTKQTRPDENCPANMKCLLVQDEDGTPHWYPIIEP